MSIEAMGTEFMRKYGSAPKRKRKKSKRKSYSVSGKGWVNEPARHSMSAYGISSGRKQKEYAPKSTFRSAPLIKAGIGLGVAGVGATASFIAKRREEAKAKEEERKRLEAQKKIEADYRYDGEIIPAREPIEQKIPFVKKLQERERDIAFKEAQLRALKEKDIQYARVLKARKNGESE